MYPDLFAYMRMICAPTPESCSSRIAALVLALQGDLRADYCGCERAAPEIVGSVRIDQRNTAPRTSLGVSLVSISGMEDVSRVGMDQR